MPRDPQHDIPGPREIEMHIRDLKKKMGIKDEPMPPGTGNELWPGGPSVDTNDIRVTSRRKKRDSSTGMA